VFEILVIENKEKGGIFLPNFLLDFAKKGVKCNQKSLERGDLKK